MRTRGSFLLAANLLMVLALHSSATEPDPQPKPIVYVVGGIGGLDLFISSAESAISASKLPYETRPFVWQHGRGRFLKDLQDTEHLLCKARELADEIRVLLLDTPKRPIYLLAHSAGTGLVVEAAKLLPPGSLERIILTSSALSPDYDLRDALRATRREIVSFHSVMDWFVLGWGTWQFGTVDRSHCSSAGMSGFKVPTELTEADRELYARLIQVQWRFEAIAKHHLGLHLSPTLPGFMTRQVVPWLK